MSRRDFHHGTRCKSRTGARGETQLPKYGRRDGARARASSPREERSAPEPAAIRHHLKATAYSATAGSPTRPERNRTSEPSADQVGRSPNDVSCVSAPPCAGTRNSPPPRPSDRQHDARAVGRPGWLGLLRGRASQLPRLPAVERLHPDVEVARAIRCVGDRSAVVRKRHVRLQPGIEGQAAQGSIDGGRRYVGCLTLKRNGLPVPP